MRIRPLGVVAGLTCVLALCLQLGLAAAASEPLAASPVATRSSAESSIRLPAQAEEWVTLIGLTALLFGMRVAGLTKRDARKR